MNDEEFFKYIYKETFETLVHQHAFAYTEKFMDALFTCRNMEALKESPGGTPEEVLNVAYEKLFERIRYFNNIGHKTTSEIDRLYKDGNLTPDKLSKILADGYDALK